MKHHLFAGFYPVNELADLADDAGNIVAENMRQWNFNARETLSYPDVEMIERARADVEKDFGCVDGGSWYVCIFEDLGAAMVIEDNGFHGFFEVSATMLVGFKRSIWLRNYMGKMPMPRRKPHRQDAHATVRHQEAAVTTSWSVDGSVCWRA